MTVPPAAATQRSSSTPSWRRQLLARWVLLLCQAPRPGCVSPYCWTASLIRAHVPPLRCRYRHYDRIGCSTTLVQAAIDQHRSELAGQEVAFAKAIAAERKGYAEDQAAPENGKTRADIDADLFAAAERKRAIDEAKSARAGEDYKHVSRLESRRWSLAGCG